MAILMLEVLTLDALARMSTPVLWSYVAEAWHRVNRCGQPPPYGELAYRLALREMHRRAGAK